jgi:ribosomal protein S18 acetylase RimI-like enzyme
MICSISLRPAVPADSNLIARLVYSTMGIEADWLFGQKKGLATLQVMADLSRDQENRLSHSLVYLAESNNQVVGLLLAYPGRLLSRLNWMTGWSLLKIWGISATIRLARIQSAYGDLKEADADKFYISNLAVLPPFEGQGIGSRLMAFAEDLAQNHGHRKCSLIVAFGHERACRLYDHLGYKIAGSFLNGHPKVAEGSGGYYRMVKQVALSSLSSENCR